MADLKTIDAALRAKSDEALKIEIKKCLAPIIDNYGKWLTIQMNGKPERLCEVLEKVQDGIFSIQRVDRQNAAIEQFMKRVETLEADVQNLREQADLQASQ